MTETEIEYQETKTVTESVYVCDDCGREVDEGGESFDVTETSEIHFCSECLEEMTDGAVTSARTKRVEEWMDYSDEFGGFSENINYVRSIVKFFTIIHGIGAVGFSILYIVSSDPAMTVSAILLTLSAILWIISFIGADILQVQANEMRES